MLGSTFSMALIICVINIVYVSFFTLRMILTIKSLRYLAAFVSIFEVIIYILGLSIVLDNLDGIHNVIAYAIGYAIGVVVGSVIEEKLALGYITVNVVSTNPSLNFSEHLRKNGFGVTSWISSGMEGDRLSMQILTTRKREETLYNHITKIDPQAFVVAYEPKYVKGGFWVRQVRRQNLTIFRSGKVQVLKDTVPTEKLEEDNEVVEKYNNE